MLVGGREMLHEFFIYGDVLNWFSLQFDKGKYRILL